MKLTLFAILTIFMTAACSTGSSSGQTAGQLPTGEEVGKKVSKRTQDADIKDNSGVIIASSEDGRDEEVDEQEPSKMDQTEKAPIGTWVEIGPDGAMSGADGESLTEIPKPDETGRMIIRHRQGVSSEVIASTIEKLRKAGWSEVTVTVVADEVDEGAANDSGSEDEADPAEAAGKDEKEATE